MIYRHPKRWCDDCKMMVLARGHAHGQGAEGASSPSPGKTQAADANRALTEAQQHIVKAKDVVDKESQRILNERLESAVGKLK